MINNRYLLVMAKAVVTGLKRWWRYTYLRLCRLPVLGTLILAGVKGTRDVNKDAAASVAFFSFFSLFPLILGAIAAGSLMLDKMEVQNYLYEIINNAFPGSGGWVTDNINSLIRYREGAGIASMIMLIWSARRVTGAISRGVNLALEEQRDFLFLLSPLRNFFITLGVTLLILIPVAVTPVLSILDQLNLFNIDSSLYPLLQLATKELTDVLSNTLALAAIYMLVPYHRPPVKALFTGALVAALGLLLAKELFLVYISNLNHLEALYGSVTSVIVLMLWLYCCAYLLLFGAQVTFTSQHPRYRLVYLIRR